MDRFKSQMIGNFENDSLNVKFVMMNFHTYLLLMSTGNFNVKSKVGTHKSIASTLEGRNHSSFLNTLNFDTYKNQND